MPISGTLFGWKNCLQISKLFKLLCLNTFNQPKQPIRKLVETFLGKKQSTFEIYKIVFVAKLNTRQDVESSTICLYNYTYLYSALVITISQSITSLTRIRNSKPTSVPVVWIENQASAAHEVNLHQNKGLRKYPKFLKQVELIFHWWTGILMCLHQSLGLNICWMAYLLLKIRLFRTCRYLHFVELEIN